MKPLPPWDTVATVQVRRQGGVVAIPALARPRMISPRECPQDERGRLWEVLVQAAAMADDQCGAGDQRYFTIEIRRDGDEPPLRFSVPEAGAPQTLIRLWRDGKA